MNYQKIYTFDLANGEGIRASVFVSGCNRQCEGCFNKEAWDFCSGKQFTPAHYSKVLEIISNPIYDGISILGGEPFDQNEQGIQILIELCKSTHNLGKTVWIWSGHEFEELNLMPEARKLLANCDVLIDGPFIEEQKDRTLLWRGSKNQRIIDVQKSLEEGKVVERE